MSRLRRQPSGLFHGTMGATGSGSGARKVIDMAYSFGRAVDGDFDDAVSRVREALAAEGAHVGINFHRNPELVETLCSELNNDYGVQAAGALAQQGVDKCALAGVELTYDDQ